MSNKYRLLLNRFFRVRSSFSSAVIPIITKYNTPRHQITPCLLSFSIFTWLGFKEKLSAEDDLIHTIKHCILFIQKEEYEKAEQLLHVALRQAQQIQHEMGITYIYDVMANLALQREHLDKAKQLFVAVAQRIMASGAKEDDFRVVHISAKLARVSHLQKEYSTAQLGYEWCLEKLREAYKDDPSDNNKKLLALTEDWYGRLFIDCNRCEDGLNLMINSLNKIRELPDVEKEHIVTQLNDVGTVYDRLGQSDESIQYFKEAIEMAKSIDMEDLGTLYVNLGRAYMKKKLFDAARKYCGHAWKLAITSKNKTIKEEAESCLKEIKNSS